MTRRCLLVVALLAFVVNATPIASADWPSASRPSVHDAPSAKGANLPRPIEDITLSPWATRRAEAWLTDQMQVILINRALAEDWSRWSQQWDQYLDARRTSEYVEQLIVTIGPAKPLPPASATIPAASCEQPAVEAALALAVSGKTVTIPAGTCSWSTYVVVPSGVTLQGAGAGVTVLNENGAASDILVYLAGGSNRLTGVTIGCGVIQARDDGFRVDHNTITCATFGEGVWVTQIVSPTANPKGLVDNNTFVNRRVLVYGFPASTLDELHGATQWSEPLALGTDEATYVETNTFTFNAVFGNAMDCQFGGRYVFRYNTVTDVYIEAHTFAGVNRACRKWEIYENTITMTGSQHAQVVFWMLIRGGTGVVYNNTMIGTLAGVGVNLSADNRRDYDGPVPSGLCDGSSTWDGNTALGSGYACRDQVGRGIDAAPFDKNIDPPSQSLDAAYVWGNTVNGSAAGIVLNSGTLVAHIASGRDYYLNVGAKPGYTAYTYPFPWVSP